MLNPPYRTLAGYAVAVGRSLRVEVLPTAAWSAGSRAEGRQPYMRGGRLRTLANTRGYICTKRDNRVILRMWAEDDPGRSDPGGGTWRLRLRGEFSFGTAL